MVDHGKRQMTVPSSESYIFVTNPLIEILSYWNYSPPEEGTVLAELDIMDACNRLTMGLNQFYFPRACATSRVVPHLKDVRELPLSIYFTVKKKDARNNTAKSNFVFAIFNPLDSIVILSDYTDKYQALVSDQDGTTLWNHLVYE